MPSTKKLLLFLIILSILFSGCSLFRRESGRSAELAEKQKETGNIAGVIDFTPSGFFKAKLYLSKKPGPNWTFETDSLGRFYISGLEPGVYFLRTTAEKYQDLYVKSYFIWEIRVAPGSTSVAHLPVWLSQIMAYTSQRQWEGEIIEIDSQAFIDQYPREKLLKKQKSKGKGNIAGYVGDPDSGPFKDAYVVVDYPEDTYMTDTDSLGRFFIPDVDCGVYTVYAGHWDYHRFYLDGVRVAEDSTSIVKFPIMWHLMIPEEPFPVGWEETIIKCDSACFFEKTKIE